MRLINNIPIRILQVTTYYQYFYIFGDPLTRAAYVIHMASITDRLFYFNFELLVTFLTDTDVKVKFQISASVLYHLKI